MRASRGTNLRAVPGGLSLPQPSAQTPIDDVILPDPDSVDHSAPPATQEQDVVLPTDTPSLQEIHRQLSQIDPDHASKVMQLADKTGENPAFVDKNLPQVEKAAAAPDGGFFQQLEAQYPGTTQFLTQPKNMAVAHDDIDNLKATEGLVQGTRQAHGMLESAQAGYQSALTGMILRQANPDLTLPADAPVQDRFAHGFAAMLADLPEFATAGLVSGAAGTLAGGPIAGAAAGAYGGFAIPAGIKEGMRAHFEKGDIQGMADLWDRAYGIAKESTKQGLVGLVTGGAGALVGKLGAGAVTGLAVEAGALGTAGPLVEGQTPTLQGYLDNALLLGSFHAATAAGSVGEYAAEKYKARRAEVGQEFYDNAGKAIAESKLAKRDPDLHESFVADVVKDSPVQTVMISPEVLKSFFQEKKIDPTAALVELGATDSFKTAEATGTKVEIPFEKWLSKMTPDSHYQALKDDVTFFQDDLSANEKTARTQAVAADVQAAEAAAKAAPEAQPAAEAPTNNPIREEIARQLKEAGLSAKEVKFNPQLYESFFKVLGDKYGLDPVELAKKFPLEIKKDAAPAGGQTLNQDEIAAAQAPAFYSKLSQTVEQKMGGSATPEQINGMLREIKPEERKWSGLDGFLEGKTKVSKADLLSFLQENQIRVQDVTKGSTADAIREQIHQLDQTPDRQRDEAWTARRGELFTQLGDATDHGTKFDQYTLPGGENYREVLFTLPVTGKAPSFVEWFNANHTAQIKSADELTGLRAGAERRYEEQKYNGSAYKSFHFDEANVLAHVRLNDRTDLDGKRVLFAEEIQSDWHQEGRKKGYKGDEKSADLAALDARIESLKEESRKLNASSDAWEQGQRELNLLRQQRDDLKAMQRGAVPDAPFKKTWQEFALKKILRMAAEQGYDKVAWTTGEQQAERYSLAKKIDRIEYKPSKATPGSFKVTAIDKAEHSLGGGEKTMSPEEIASNFGKEVADRIAKDEGKPAEDGYKHLSGDGLSVGGEGMKGFYDKILVDAANKFVKKSGTKVEPGHVETPNGTAPAHEIEITPALKKQILGEGFSLFQGENNPRGQISFKSTGEAIMSLFTGKRDKSTFLHESGHYFLHVLGEVAKMDGAPEYVKEDYQEILKYLGVKSFDEIGTAQQEVWAKSFESYLREGKAPSEGLRKAFYHFKSWLTKIYENVKNQLGVELSPEIRGVMDRMLATRDEIETASKLIGIEPPPEIPGLDPAVAKKLGDLQERARDAAEGSLLKEQMKELTEKHQEMLTSEREKLTDSAKEQVSALPVFKAIEDLQSLESKFTNKQHKEPARLAEKFMAGKLDSEDASNWEALAEVHGFASGQDLALKITQAVDGKLYDAAVKQIVDQGMAAHAPLMESGALREAALKAVHTERGTELLALEHAVLQDLVSKAKGSAHQAEVSREASRRNQIEARLDAKAAQDSARETLAKKPVKESGNPRTYVTAERNAAVKVAKALASGDYAKAAEAKRQQMASHALATEAMRNRTEADKAMRFIEPFARRGLDLLGMPYGFATQVDAVLERFGMADSRGDNLQTMTEVAVSMLSKGEEPEDIANATGLKQDAQGRWSKESLADFVTRVNENYYALTLPDNILQGAAKAGEDLTLAELRSVRDAVKAVASTGKKYGRFLGEFATMDIRQTAAQLKTSIAENFGTPFAESLLMGSQHETKLSEWLAQANDLPAAFERVMDTMLTTLHKLDGLKEGIAKDSIYRPLATAEAAKMRRVAETMKTLDEIFGKHYTPEEFQAYKETRINVDGRYFTKEQLLSMALNFGNEGNIDRLTRGAGPSMGWTPEKILHVLESNLEKKDFDFAQAIWKHIGSYWPDISKLEMDVNGVEPKRVDSKPFVTKYGAYEGGYYPISYDSLRSADSFKNSLEKDALFKQFAPAKAHTAQGHAQERLVSVQRPLNLSLDVIRTHLNDVIHDLEYRRPVIDAARLLNNKDTKSALVQALGVKGYAAINDWLKFVAGGTSEPLAAGDKIFQWFRFKTSFYNLGYRITTAPKILLENGVNASSELGLTGAARAVKDYYLNKGQNHEMVISKSEFMKQRAEHLTRDISDITDKYRGQQRPAFQRYAFFIHAFLDQGMSFPVWADVYRSGINDHGVEAKAIHQADEAVKRTFMSGGVLDQAAISRGGEKQKALTTAFGYSAMMWNRFSQSGRASYREAELGNYGSAAAIAARAMVYQFLLPAVIASVTREFIRNSLNPSPDDRARRMAASFLEEAGPWKFVPVLRDVAPYFIKKSLGEHTRDLQVTPLEGAAQTLLEPAGEMFGATFGHSHLSPKFPEKVVNAVSLLGVPYLGGAPKEVNDLVFNFIDWQTQHGAATWRDFVSRRTQK